MHAHTQLSHRNCLVAGLTFSRISPISWPCSAAMTIVRQMFVVHNLSQSTPVVSSVNKMRCFISTVISITPSAKITIFGMTGTAQTSTSELPIASSTNSSISAVGTWTQANGTLVVTVGAEGLEGKGRIHELSWELLNPAQGQAPPYIEISLKQQLGRQDIPVTLLSSDSRGGVFKALAVADFLTRDISRISDYGPYPSTDFIRTSTIQVTLVPATDLRVGGLVIIEGLTGALGPSSVNLGSFLDLQVSSWELSVGKLALQISRVLTQNTTYSFGVLLQSPRSGQSSPNIYILAQDAHYGKIISRNMTKGLGNKAPLLINDFQVLQIGQSDPSASSPNVLSITLSTRAALELINEDIQIYICGLKGSTTSSTAALPLVSTHNLFGSSARWENGPWLPNGLDQIGSNCLILNVLSDSVPYTSYEFSFSLRNQLAPQAAQTITIFLYTTGKNINAWDPVLQAELPSDLSSGFGNKAAMLIAGFLQASAWQTSGNL